MYSFITSGNFVIFKYTEDHFPNYEHEVFKLHNTSTCIDWGLTEDTDLITFTIDETRYENVPLSSIDFDDVVCQTQEDFIDGVQGMFENLAPGSSGGVESVTAEDASITVGGTATEPTVKLPYKIYTALLSQSGTNAPVATVLQPNTIGEVTWEYNSEGIFSAVSDGLFTIGKTTITASPTGGFVGAFPNSDDTANKCEIQTSNQSGVAENDWLVKNRVQIIVYP